MLRRSQLTLLIALSLGGAVGRARADGAFPDQLHVFVPADEPNEVILATNFGLVESADDGQSWFYVCEAVAGSIGTFDLYQMGPTDTLLWISTSGLFRSSDLACSWGAAGGALASSFAWDACFDPNAPGHVLALADPPDAGGTLGVGATAIYPSSDDATTFGPPVLITRASLSGIELSLSSPGLVYVTGNEPADAGPGPYGIPFVLVGADGGASWDAPIDHPELAALLAAPDAGVPLQPLIRLAQVDPVDAQTVYLTLTIPGSTQTFLAVTHDGGKTMTVIFRSPEPLRAFLRGADETLYAGSDAGLFEAPPSDAGLAFTLVHQACLDGGVPDGGGCDISVRAVSERGGVLYVSADNWPPDEMAVGTSTDHGVHFTRLLQFVDIAGLGCGGAIEESCGPTWCGAGGLVGLFAIDGGGCPSPPRSTLTGTSPTTGCTCGSGGGDLSLLAVLAVVVATRPRRRADRQSRGQVP